MSTQILFGVKPPKNWRENLQKQKDPEYQRLRELWDKETDPELEAKYYKQMNDYWAAKKAEQSRTSSETTDEDWNPDPDQMADQGMNISAHNALERSLSELYRQDTEKYGKTQPKS